MFIPDREELAWAGGFFDGEGNLCFTLSSAKNRSRSRRLTLSIGQSGIPETLIRFRGAVGNIGSVTGPYQMPKATMPHWRYTVSRFEYVQAIVAMMSPFLSSVKRDQVIRAFKSYSAYKSELTTKNAA